MTMVAVLCAMVAAAIALPTSERMVLARLAPASHRLHPHHRGRIAVAVAVAAGVVSGAALIDGTRGIALAIVGGVVSGTFALIARKRVRARRALTRRKEVARASEVLGSLIRIGHVPSAALGVAAQDCPILTRAAAIQRVGGDPVAALVADGETPGADGLVAIAQAWKVSAATGAPIVAALDAVTTQLRAAKDLAHLVHTELAAPRATGQLLAALPFAGVALGLAMGGDPIRFLTGSWLGQACLVSGVILAAVGVLWSEALADRAADSAGI